MVTNNDYFHYNDLMVEEIGGERVHPDFWSRFYEWAWAIYQLEHHKGDRVADMGTGWMHRTFRDNYLATHYPAPVVVDRDERLLSADLSPNLIPVIADIQDLPADWDGRFDKILCISVIEDVPSQNIRRILQEFERCLAPQGRIFLTFDTPFDERRPCPVYPGLPLDILFDAMNETGLAFDGDVPMYMHKKRGDNRIYHDAWNLTVYHCVLMKLPHLVI